MQNINLFFVEYIPWIVVGVVLLLITLAILTSYICYLLTFHNKPYNLDPNDDEIKLPGDAIYRIYRKEIIQDIQDVRKIPYQEMAIKSFDGLILKGKYYEYQKGASIELMMHGYRGNGERDLSTGVLRAFKCKRNVLLVDQRASGSSEGKVISFGINEYKDCLKWVDHLIETFGEDVKIYLTGVSMGAATVINAASCDNLPKNVIGVLADCGYDNQKEIIKKYVKDLKLPPSLFYPFIKLGAKLFGKFDLEEIFPIDAVKKIKIPVIFIHGDSDSFVPCYMSENMYKACNSEKSIVIIKGSDHGVAYLVNPDYYIEELNKVFNK